MGRRAHVDGRLPVDDARVAYRPQPTPVRAVRTIRCANGKRSANDGDAYSPRGAGRGSDCESNSACLAVAARPRAPRAPAHRAIRPAKCRPWPRSRSRRRRRRWPSRRGRCAATNGSGDVLADRIGLAVFVDETQRPEVGGGQARQVGQRQAIGVGHGAWGFRSAGGRAGTQRRDNAKGVIIAGIAPPQPALTASPDRQPQRRQRPAPTANHGRRGP